MRFPRLPVIDHSVGRVTAALDAPTYSPSSLPYASPYASDTLNQVIFEDIVGKGVVAPISRAQAMKIPTVARARNLMVSTIARFPLVAFAGPTQLTPEATPSWMHATAGPLHPSFRIAWTVDDLIFYGWSLWSRYDFSRIGKDRWRFDGDGHVLVDGVVARADEVILIPGLHEGILEYGNDTLADAKALYRNVRQRLKNPAPQLMLKQTGGTDLTEDQIDSLIARWAKAREGENGGVGFANSSIDVSELGAADPALMIEARNAMSLDIARMIGISGGKLDATTPKASLNYETTTGRNEEFVDTDVQLYMTPISARLSMDDVLPSGQRAAFDMGDFIGTTPSPTGPGALD